MKRDKRESNCAIRPDDLIVFCGELSLFLRAGNPVEECFARMLDNGSSLPRQLLGELHQYARAGVGLADSLGQSGAFPEYLVTMTRAGEETGHLDEVFAALSDYYTTQKRLQETLRNAVRSPLLLLIVALLVIFLVLPKVLPIYSQVFSDLGGEIPAVTYLILQAAEGLQAAGWVVPGILGVLALLAILVVAVPPWRKKGMDWCRSRFYRSKTGKTVNAAFFASLLSLGVSGGMDLDDTMGLIEDGFSARWSVESVAVCRGLLAEGIPFAQAVERSGLLAPNDSLLLGAGIQSGQTERALDEIVRRTEDASAQALEGILGKLEPAIVLVMSVVVGVMLLAVLFPLLGIMSALTGG